MKHLVTILNATGSVMWTILAVLTYGKEWPLFSVAVFFAVFTGLIAWARLTSKI